MKQQSAASKRPASDLTPLVFLDIDDVLCISRQYGGRSVVAANPPEEMWAALFHPPAVATLQAIVDEFEPRFILTTSWLLLIERPGFERLFVKCGMRFVAERLHDAWEAPQFRGKSRLDAIERWLGQHHRSEAFVVLDDAASGTGLTGSRLQAAGRVVLCEVGVGLHRGYLPQVERALRVPS